MRLTLRTLLAWVDGVLEAEDHHSLGKRISDSQTASGVAKRIALVAGRRDLGAPEVSAWGSPDDANVVAAYIDNSLCPNEIDDFERRCLQTEVLLAEVADCHGALAELSKCAVDDEALTDAARRGLGMLVRHAVSRVSWSSGCLADECGSGADDPDREPAARVRVVVAPVVQPRSFEESEQDVSGETCSPAAAAASQAGRQILRRLTTSCGPVAVLCPVRQRPSTPSRTAFQRTTGSRRRQPRDTVSDNLCKVAAIVLLVTMGWGAVKALGFGGQGGFSRRAAVRGFVTFDGMPLKNGVVLLLPAGETKGPTAGSTVSKGAFSIAVGSGPVVGRYRVEIKANRKTGRKENSAVPVGGRHDRDETVQFIPAMYNTASQIEIDVRPGRNTITLDLKSPSEPVAKPGSQPKPRIAAGRERFPVGGTRIGRPG